MTQHIASRSRRLWATLAALGVVSVASSLLAPSASAAPGDPWNSAAPTVFVSLGPQGSNTQLHQSVADGNGGTDLEPIGPVSDFHYNALAFNPADNYLYAIAVTAGTAGDGSAIPAGSLVRIGQEGYATRVGTQKFTVDAAGGTGFFDGSMGPDGYYYATTPGADKIVVINPTTGALVRNIALSQAMPTNAADIVFAEGYFWAVSGSGGMVRIDPSTGGLVVIPDVLPNGGYGAAWQYGNGNLGIKDNGTGTIYQMEIVSPTEVRIVSSNPGPSAYINDGASSLGVPTDLQVVKEGPESYVPGETLTYTLTVTNNGEGVSSGFTLTDEVPSPLTDIQADEGCTVDAQTVTCVSGTLGVGESRQFTVTALVPEGATGTIANTATVLPNEEDSDPTNDTDDHVTEPADDCQAQDSTLVDDSASVVSGSSETIDVAGNDTIPADKQLEVVTDAGHGTVTQDADGSFTYTPEAGFVGTDTFTYTVSGPYCEPQVATVTITVTEGDEPPVPAMSLGAAVLALAGAGGLGLRRRLQA